MPITSEVQGILFYENIAAKKENRAGLNTTSNKGNNVLRAYCKTIWCVAGTKYLILQHDFSNCCAKIRFATRSRVKDQRTIRKFSQFSG